MSIGIPSIPSNMDPPSSSVSSISSLRGASYSVSSPSSFPLEEAGGIILKNIARRLEESFLETEDGTAVYICFYLIAIIFGVPILRLIYYRYVERIIDVAASKARELTKKMTERLSDAGRRVSDRAVTEKKISISG